MSKKRAVIFDIDGVISDNSNRLQYLLSDNVRYHAEFLKDKPIQEAVSLVQAFSWYRHMKDHDLEILFNTDRPSYMRDITAEWIADNIHIFNAKVFTRTRHSLLMDSVGAKKYNLERIMKNYDVVMAFDDCPEACDMYVANGIPCMQFRKELSNASKS